MTRRTLTTAPNKDVRTSILSILGSRPKLCKVLLALAAGSALAQGSLTAEEVTRSIAAAREEVLLRAPALTSAAVQQALRDAALERGIPVFIVIDAGSAWTPASYAPSLALAGGVILRLAPGVSETSFLVIDRSYVVEGPLTARAAGPFDGPTRGLRDPDLALDRVRRFILAWQGGAPLEVADADLRRLLEIP
jgi:hypothetical protein